jgi:diguanylate cyclase (GGDEF)-like protein
MAEYKGGVDVSRMSAYELKARRIQALRGVLYSVTAPEYLLVENDDRNSYALELSRWFEILGLLSLSPARQTDFNAYFVDMVREERLPTYKVVAYCLRHFSALFDAEELEAILNMGVLEVESTSDELISARSELVRKRYDEKLSMLYTYKASADALALAIREGLYNERLVLCSMLDLDKFKTANDTLGHEVGDDILLGAANAFKASIRPSDIPLRFGGDEFGLWAPVTSAESADIMLERLRAAVEAQTFDRAPNHIQTVTIGFALGDQSVNKVLHEEWAQKTMRELADQGLYDAKIEGRNRVSMKHDRPGHVWSVDELRELAVSKGFLVEQAV